MHFLVERIELSITCWSDHVMNGGSLAQNELFRVCYRHVRETAHRWNLAFCRICTRCPQRAKIVTKSEQDFIPPPPTRDSASSANARVAVLYSPSSCWGFGKFRQRTGCSALFPLLFLRLRQVPPTLGVRSRQSSSEYNRRKITQFAWNIRCLYSPSWNYIHQHATV